ncbi:regulatory iron-sulfur-containing complex subunit RicT [Limibacter armeniacum]|uniref:PSP1 domain-containing protein n=1 Tax=Limibacter armeniacum TaxID=466084 RepID=UPI002FE5B3C5
MACGSCATGACGVTSGGCGSGGSCKTGGCLKLNAYDWLGDMDLPSTQRFNVVEVKFKGGRKGFYRNDKYLELFTGDPVVVDAQNGHHIGYVSLQGEIVRLQMMKKKVEDNDEILGIMRKATDKDLEKMVFVKNRELPTMYRTREIIRELNLKMKLSDIEFQADNSKATFYYSADDRVDFRELIKILASEFKIRVEMRQISLRQEASRLGGIGSCGRELCCSTWLSDFKSVSTAAARYQNLSLNPSKLSGQCGRLKCCLNYELETYIDALVDIPIVEKPILTTKGEVQLQKVDIFKKVLWFSYEGETTWHSVPAQRVKDVLDMNAKGKKPSTIQEEAPAIEAPNTKLGSAIEKLENKRQRREGGSNRPPRKKATPSATPEPSSENRQQQRRKRRNRKTSGSGQGQQQDSSKNANAADKRIQEAAKLAAKAKQKAQQEASAKRKSRSRKRRPGGGNRPNNSGGNDA